MSHEDPGRRRAARWHSLNAGQAARRPMIYRDGSYPISSAGEATTWAVCHEGAWGVVYECNGEQILSAWVSEREIPLHVLLAALTGEAE
jgi:hypothetical protein